MCGPVAGSTPPAGLSAHESQSNELARAGVLEREHKQAGSRAGSRASRARAKLANEL